MILRLQGNTDSTRTRLRGRHGGRRRQRRRVRLHVPRRGADVADALRHAHASRGDGVPPERSQGKRPAEYRNVCESTFAQQHTVVFRDFETIVEHN